MSTQEIIIGLNGFFIPTGVYSFEFRRTRSKRKLAEIFFLLPPDQLQVNEVPQSNYAKTLTGGYITDYGNSPKTITLQGQSHFYYAGNFARPATQYGDSRNLGVEGFVDGYTEFLKLRFMVSRYRDYTLSPDGKLRSPNFSNELLGQTRNFRRFVAKQAGNGDSALEDAVDMIFHAYDYDENWKVKLNNFSYTASADDVHSITYNIELLAYEQATTNTTVSPLPPLKPSPVEQLQSTNQAVAASHPFTRPSETTVETASGTIKSTNFVDEEVPENNTVTGFENL